MDPKATLSRLVESLELSDWEDAKLAAKDLAKWLDRGGFIPDGKTAATDWSFVLGTLSDFIRDKHG